MIAIEKVAAFVDGRMDPGEEQLICDAAMIDNSVLAEIIAAVRADLPQADDLPPLSTSLQSQLMAMQAALPQDNLETPESNATESTPSTLIPQAVSVDPAHAEVASPKPIVVVPSPATASPQPAVESSSWSRITFGAVAVAASIMVAVVWWSAANRDSGGAVDPNQIAESAVDIEVIPPEPGGIPDPVPPPEADLDSSPQPTIAQADPVVDPDPVDPVDDPPMAVAVAPPEIAVPSEDKVPTEDNMLIPAEIDPMSDRPPVRLTSKPRLTDLRWTEVTGLMAQAEADADSGSTPTIKWARVQGGSQSTSDATATASRSGFALRTLPMSRAKGQLGGGGEIVVAPDTGIRMMPAVDEETTEVDLMFGAVALLDVADGTTIRVRHGRQLLATLRWNTQASAVLQRLVDGLQIQVEDGEVAINDTPVRSKSVRVANDQSVETVRSPRRLPRWITAPDDTTATDRMILAQIAETGDLHSSLQQRITALARISKLSRDESQALAKLAHWQAALSGPHVFRLAGSRVPAVRLAALNRIAQLSESDPRSEAMWRTIQRTVNNQQRVTQTRAWFRLLRSGARPNRTQLDEMLTGLTARDYAGRALSDYMLRRYVTNPPPFDPAWTGQTLQRAVNVYRQRAGVQDRLRPNAAAAGAP